MADGQELILAAHSLAETYAVLTRLPPPNRLRGKDALALIEENWAGNPIVHLTGRDSRGAHCATHDNSEWPAGRRMTRSSLRLL